MSRSASSRSGEAGYSRINQSASDSARSACARVPDNRKQSRHSRAAATVRQKAIRGGFKTARRVGRDWLIDEDEPYIDERFATPSTPPDLWLLTNGRHSRTISDAGAVKIGSDEFSALIPTGAGDGESAYCIYTRTELDAVGINTADLHYFTLVSGSFNIYDYDCGCTVSETVEGVFSVFYADGIVFFVKAE